jgi:hypothetical protein
MRKMTTTVLVTLMLVSIAAALMPNNLTEIAESADAGRGSGADVLLHDVMEPRESYTDSISGTVRNAMDAGETTNFNVVVKNDGDALLTELQIHVTVRLADNDLIPSEIDQFDDVLCDPIAGCPYENLSAGAWLANGSYEIRNSAGAALEWTPTIVGTYTVTVEVISTEDSVLTNNEMSYNVIVVPWNDISVDICWLDSQDGACTQDDRAQGTNAHHFRVTASTDGSESWDARGVTVAVAFSGSYDGDTSSIDDGTGVQTPVNSLSNSQQAFTVGADSEVEVWHNMSEIEPTSDFSDNGSSSEFSNPCITGLENPCNQDRKVATFQTEYSFDGVVSPDTNADGSSGLQAYSISAGLVSYVEYVMEEITLTDNSGGNGTSEVLIQIMHEQAAYFDDRSFNNYDDIDGVFGVYHDITLMSLTVGLDAATSGRIGVGEQWVYASVRHSGSEATNLYDWDMKFTISDENGMNFEMWADECSDPENQAQHMTVGAGPGAIDEAFACVLYNFQPGDYSVAVEVTFNNSQWTELTVGNNFDVSDFDSVNNPPSLSLVMAEIANPPIIVGNSLTFQAQASDIETENAEDMFYSWSRSSNMGPDSEFCSEGYGMFECHLDGVDESWIGDHILSVRVCDIYNACVSDQMVVSVWNELNVGVTSTDWTVNYTLVYGGMIFHNVDFSTHVQWVGEQLGELSSSYTSVVAFDLGPGLAMDGENTSTYMSFAPSSVSRESLAVTFSGDIDKTYSIWYKGASGWVQMNGAVKTASEAGGVTLTWSQTGDLPNRLDTSFAVFEAAEDTGLPPATGVICDGPVSLGPGGEMVIKWKYEDAALLVPTEDRIAVMKEGVEAQNLAVSENMTTLIGTHDTIYNISISISNSNGANPTICTRDGVQADGSVSPHPTVSNMVVVASANDITLTWDATVGDVETWKICWAAFAFEDISSLSCEATTDATTSATLSKTTVCGTACVGQYYFAAAPVDDVGNSGDAAAQKYLDLSEEIDDPGAISGPDDVEAGGGFPKLAIYMIAGVVITAVIVGAVIVTRGGGGEGKDDDFDY